MKKLLFAIFIFASLYVFLFTFLASSQPPIKPVEPAPRPRPDIQPSQPPSGFQKRPGPEEFRPLPRPCKGDLTVISPITIKYTTVENNRLIEKTDTLSHWGFKSIAIPAQQSNQYYIKASFKLKNTTNESFELYPLWIRWGNKTPLTFSRAHFGPFGEIEFNAPRIEVSDRGCIDSGYDDRLIIGGPRDKCFSNDPLIFFSARLKICIAAGLQSRIEIRSPKAGEIWEAGKSYQIIWDAALVSGPLKIMLIYENKDTGLINSYPIAEVNSTPSIYTYTVPKNIPVGNNKYKIYITTLDGSVKAYSSLFTIKTSDVKRISPPVFSFNFPKYYDNPNTKEVLVKGNSYTITWRQVRETNADLKNIKIRLINRQTQQYFWVTEGIPNRNSYTYTIPHNIPDGLYIFSIAPMSEEFWNQSPEFYISSNNDIDLVIELKNVSVSWKAKYFLDYVHLGEEYLEFEIWVMNKGTKYLPYVPIVWRILNEPNNVVILQEEAGFGDVYPNKYYKAKLRYTYAENTRFISWHKERGWGEGPFIIEAEVDPKRQLYEPEMTRGDNLARKIILYDMHIKGGRVK